MMINKIPLNGGIDSNNGQLYTLNNGIKVIASSTFQSGNSSLYQISYMFNNTPNGQYWLYDSIGGKEYIIIDFSEYEGGLINLEGLKIYPYSRSDSYADYSISISKDNGNSYEEVVPLVGNNNNNSSLGVSKDYPINIKGVSQIRIDVIPYGSWGACLNEIEVYGIPLIKKGLLKSNNKVYSLKPTEILHEIKMTSNTTPSPFVASASSHASSTYSAWKAFNGNLTVETDSWVSIANTTTGWLQLYTGTPIKINEFRLGCRIHATTANGVTYPTLMPKDFNLLGSNDGVNFDVLAEIRNEIDWKQGEVRAYNAPLAMQAYSYLRLEVLNVNGGTQINVGSLNFYNNKNLAELPSASLQNFINYGTSKNDKFNYIQSNKNYILQDTVSENADGLWVQEIDRKPLSIKFE